MGYELTFEKASQAFGLGRDTGCSLDLAPGFAAALVRTPSLAPLTTWVLDSGTSLLEAAYGSAQEEAWSDLGHVRLVSSSSLSACLRPF